MLDGDGLKVKRLLLDGAPLDINANFVTPDRLTIAAPPHEPFSLEIETELNPAANTQLMGLYRSGSAYCTQCEAEGFRRITYFLDRPDVLSVYSVRLEAERAEAPVLLANGNRIAAGAIEGTTRHFAVWHDPFPEALLSLRPGRRRSRRDPRYVRHRFGPRGRSSASMSSTARSRARLMRWMP